MKAKRNKGDNIMLAQLDLMGKGYYYGPKAPRKKYPVIPFEVRYRFPWCPLYQPPTLPPPPPKQGDGNVRIDEQSQSNPGGIPYRFNPAIFSVTAPVISKPPAKHFPLYPEQTWGCGRYDPLVNPDTEPEFRALIKLMNRVARKYRCAPGSILPFKNGYFKEYLERYDRDCIWEARRLFEEYEINPPPKPKPKEHFIRTW